MDIRRSFELRITQMIKDRLSVYTKIDNSSYAYIWFYETEEGYLKILFRRLWIIETKRLLY